MPPTWVLAPLLAFLLTCVLRYLVVGVREPKAGMQLFFLLVAGWMLTLSIIVATVLVVAVVEQL